MPGAERGRVLNVPPILRVAVGWRPNFREARTVDEDASHTAPLALAPAGLEALALADDRSAVVDQRTEVAAAGDQLGARLVERHQHIRALV